MPLCLAKPDAFRSSPLRRPAPDVTGVSREEFAPERQVSQIRTSWEFRSHFGGTAFILGIALAFAAWAFHTSLGGRKLWKEDFFG